MPMVDLAAHLRMVSKLVLRPPPNSTIEIIIKLNYDKIFITSLNIYGGEQCRQFDDL